MKWKWLIIALAVVGLALLNSLWAPVALAQTWESYRNVACGIVWGTPANSYDAQYTTVYMCGAGFIQNQNYNIGYYDGANNWIFTDSNVKATGGGGNLKSQYLLTTNPTAVQGTWHSSVYLASTSPPSTYQSVDPTRIADDTFEALKEAIPEFPTILTAVGVAAMVFAIYYWLRRKRVYRVRGVC